MGDRTLVKFKFRQNFNLLKVSESCDISIQIKISKKTQNFSLLFNQEKNSIKFLWLSCAKFATNKQKNNIFTI